MHAGSSTPVETKHRRLAYSSHAARAILSDSEHIEALLSFLQGRVRMTLAMQVLHEPYAHLYVGDYFADTLDLSAHEHCALRLLLLETWVHGPVGHVRLASVAGLTKEEWQAIKPAVCLCCAACSRELSRVSTTYGISTGNGFRQPTGTSSAASLWSAIDMPAPIAVQTSSSKPIISFRSAAAVPMPARLLPLELDPSPTLSSGPLSACTT